MERRIISVSELNGVVKLLLDNEPLLRNLAVRGELSNYKIYPSGHHYFTLKDPEGPCAAYCSRDRPSASASGRRTA